MPARLDETAAPAAPAPHALAPESRTLWRAPLAAACAVAAAAHVPVTHAYLRDASYVGVLFVLLEVAAATLAVRLLRPPSRRVLLAVSALGAAALVAFIVSRTIGLPLIPDDVGDWTEPLAVIAAATEALMAVGGTAALLGRRSAGRAPLGGLVVGVLILLLGGAAVGLAAAVELSPQPVAPVLLDPMGGMHH